MSNNNLNQPDAKPEVDFNNTWQQRMRTSVAGANAAKSKNSAPRFRNRIIAVLLSAASLSGCASQATLAYRDDMRAACKAGDGNACYVLPVVEERVTQEASENGAKIAGGILLGLAAGADAYNESRRPTYIVVRPCRWC